MGNLGKLTVVVGGQFGSEAKGKVCAYLADEFDVAVRTGSPNAGHTVVLGDENYKLRQIPTAFINPNCQLCLGAGSLIDPTILKQEVNLLGIRDRLFIDYQAGIIEEKHHLEEAEIVEKIGSTGSGSGYALINRVHRRNFNLAKDVLKEYKQIKVADALNKALDEGYNVLLEGTQGYGLSIFHGIYPFVTSRDTTASAFLAESGLSPRLVTDIILVIRTYPIRVAGNSGPINNEITWDELSRRIGKEVMEVTTVTKKTRRVAEFDIDLVKRAIQVNRPTQIALQFLNYKFPETENLTSWEELSEASKKYIEDLENELGVPITLIGTGADNKSMIDLRKKKMKKIALQEQILTSNSA